MRKCLAVVLALLVSVQCSFALEVVEDVEPDLLPDNSAVSVPEPPEVLDDMEAGPDGLPAEVPEDDEDTADTLELDSIADGLSQLYELVEGYLYPVPDDDPGPGIVPYMDTSLIPSYGYSMAVSSSLGDAVIFLPREASQGALCWSESGVLMNVTNSTISGLLAVNGRTYQMRFASFDSAEYYYSYTSSGSLRWTWGHFTIHQIEDLKGVSILEADPLRPVPDTLLPYIYIGLELVIVCLLFTRR